MQLIARVVPARLATRFQRGVPYFVNVIVLRAWREALRSWMTHTKKELFRAVHWALLLDEAFSRIPAGRPPLRTGLLSNERLE